MIDNPGRCVIQRVGFLGPRTYRRQGPASVAPAHVDTVREETSFVGLYRATDTMDMKPGEVVAVWDLPADEMRPFAQVIQDLPPVPSRLLVRTRDRQLLELNPAYIDANENPDLYEETGYADSWGNAPAPEYSAV